MTIVAGVVAEMKIVGNHQWDESYPDVTRFARDVDSGSLYVAQDAPLENEEGDVVAGDVIGFITVDQDEPPGYHGLPWSDRGAFLVIHRLAVDPDRRAVGVATALEAFVCSLAADKGVTHLKIDTYSTNAAMQAFLRRIGYRKVGDMEFRGKPLPFYCYEKLLESDRP